MFGDIIINVKLINKHSDCFQQILVFLKSAVCYYNIKILIKYLIKKSLRFFFLNNRMRINSFFQWYNTVILIVKKIG